MRHGVQPISTRGSAVAESARDSSASRALGLREESPTRGPVVRQGPIFLNDSRGCREVRA